MAWQLIYTSAPRGLVAGRSGFCTVARHREIRDGLVTAIERFSQYDRAGRTAGTPNPVIYAYRIVRLGGSTYHVLSCTRDAGADYTGRTNHLAHHLICEPHELAAAPSPAEVLRQTAWLRTWTGEPRYFGTEEMVALSRIPRSVELPARSWQTFTGDAGCAALPLESGALGGGAWLYPADAGETFLLPLFAESLLLLDPPGHSAEKFWQIPFTTYLQSTDHAADFMWRGCALGSPAALAAQGARQTLDLTQPHQLHPPANKTAELARTGRTASSDSGPAAPTAREPKDFPPSAASVPPAAAAPPGEIDLAELLASADEAKSPKGKWARSKLGAAAESSNAGRGPGSRRLPLKWLVAAGVAVVLGGVFATGFVMWRDGKAEQLRGELARARNGEDFARGPALIATASTILRSYEPLKVEIERTQVAVDLDGLKNQTPDDAAKYLINHRERLAAPAVQNDFQLKARFEKIEQWRKADQSLSELNTLINSPEFAGATNAEAIRMEFVKLGKQIDALDKPYRPSITNRLLESKRTHVRRRFEKLKLAGTGALAQDNFMGADSKLIEDAKALGMTDLMGLIEDFRKEQIKAQTRPKTESTEKPPAPAPAVAKAVESASPLGLPAMPTYIAIGSAAGFDVSSVAGKRGFPATGKWLLFRSLGPGLQPQGAGEACELQNGKLYDASSKVLLTIKPPIISLGDDKTLGRSESFLLRIADGTDAADQLQIVFWQAGESAFHLPVKGQLTRDADQVILDGKLAAAIEAIKPASANATYVLKRSATRSSATTYRNLKLDLSKEMESAAAQVTSRKNLAAGPEASLKQSKAIESERAKLLGLLDDVGLRLFRGYTRMEKKDQVPAVDGKHQVAGIKRFLKRGDEVVPFNTDKQLVDYFQEILWTLGKLDTERQKEIDAIHDKIRHEWENIRKPEAMVQIWRTVPALAGKNVKAIGEEKRTPLDKFCDTWEKLFSEENVPTILAFYRGSGVEAAKAIKDAEAKLTPAQAELAKAQAALDRLKADLPELGPFFLDLEFPGPNPAVPPQVVRLIEFSAESASQPPPAK